MRIRLAFVLLVILAVDAGARKYRITGRTYTEEEVRAKYDLVKEKYVLQKGKVLPAERVGAFLVPVKVLSVIDQYTIMGKAAGPVKQVERPDSAPTAGARYGKTFTIAETSTNLIGNISSGMEFAVRLQKTVKNMPLTKAWELMVVDSRSVLDRVKQGRIKGKDLGEVRVLYDVTMTFDDFVRLLQRNHVFPELAGK